MKDAFDTEKNDDARDSWSPMWLFRAIVCAYFVWIMWRLFRIPQERYYHWKDPLEQNQNEIRS